MTAPWLDLAQRILTIAKPPAEPVVPAPPGAPTLERFLQTLQQAPMGAAPEPDPIMQKIQQLRAAGYTDEQLLAMNPFDREGPRATPQQLLAQLRQEAPMRPDATGVNTPSLVPQRHPGEQYIADLPGIGGGLVDTVRMAHGSPLVLDTASLGPNQLGEYQPSWKRFGQPARVLINPELAKSASSEELVTLLGHEGIAHGPGKVGPWANHQEQGDDYGRALLALSGRIPTPIRKTDAYLDLQRLFRERLP